MIGASTNAGKFGKRALYRQSSDTSMTRHRISRFPLSVCAPNRAVETQVVYSACKESGSMMDLFRFSDKAPRNNLCPMTSACALVLSGRWS